MGVILTTLLTLLLVVSGLAHAEHRYKLCVAAIFHNEARFLREWIEYHKLVGVEHFYLYNHLNDDNYLEVLEPYLQSEEVTLVDWPLDPWDGATTTREYRTNWAAVQLKARRHVLENADSDWLAYLDTDEFLVSSSHDTLIELLEEYERQPNVGVISLAWVLFGTSGVERIPEDRLMIETLLLHWPQADNFVEAWTHHRFLKVREPWLRHKSIVRTDCVDNDCFRIPRHVHIPACMEDKEHRFVPVEEAQINHYWTRDREYLREVKIPRRQERGFSTNWCNVKARFLIERSRLSEPILRFVPQLRAAMGMSEEVGD